MFGLLSIISPDDIDKYWDIVKTIFLGFTFNDAVDIILLTVFFFVGFKFMKNRKVGALIVGIFLCLLIYVVASVYDLSGVKYILSGIFQVGVLAVVIIFQPELRDVLEKLGSGSIQGIRGIGDHTQKKQVQFKIIENVCKAVRVMAADKTGALIVIERTTSLTEHINSGIAINGDVSDSLLRNLFFNRAPLHDGAVIISDGKIASASCILPLPKHTVVDSELGTRHRAAIGLSEVSDALIIVVSEETGIISVAKEGELLRDFTEESLRKYLLAHFVKDKHDQET